MLKNPKFTQAQKTKNEVNANFRKRNFLRGFFFQMKSHRAKTLTKTLFKIYLSVEDSRVIVAF